MRNRFITIPLPYRDSNHDEPIPQSDLRYKKRAFKLRVEF